MFNSSGFFLNFPEYFTPASHNFFSNQIWHLKYNVQKNIGFCHAVWYIFFCKNVPIPPLAFFWPPPPRSKREKYNGHFLTNVHLSNVWVMSNLELAKKWYLIFVNRCFFTAKRSRFRDLPNCSGIYLHCWQRRKGFWIQTDFVWNIKSCLRCVVLLDTVKIIQRKNNMTEKGQSSSRFSLLSRWS